MSSPSRLYHAVMSGSSTTTSAVHVLTVGAGAASVLTLSSVEVTVLSLQDESARKEKNEKED